MSDEIQKDDKPEVLPDTTNNGTSRIGTLSIRALIALILVASICACVFLSKTIPDVLANLAISVVSFYFGHEIGKK